MTIRRLEFGHRPYIMGIMNVTPDSFSGDGLLQDLSQGPCSTDELFVRLKQWISEGMDILDIGGESTRPGATPVSEKEEIARVIPIIKVVAARYSIPISVDTTKAAVAEAAIKAGACLVNDVSGLMLDPRLCEVVRTYGVPVILTHNPLVLEGQQTGQQSDEEPKYWGGTVKEVVSLVAHDLEKLAIHAISRGLTRQQIILDPGIGFGKTPEQNLFLLNHVDRLKALGYPVLIGSSRKSFIGSLANAAIDKRLPGSLITAALAALKGADILRVHDVGETMQVVKILQALKEVECQ